MTDAEKYEIARATLRRIGLMKGPAGVAARSAMAACNGYDDPGAQEAAAIPQTRREGELREALEHAADAARKLVPPLADDVLAVVAPICRRAIGPCFCGCHRDLLPMSATEADRPAAPRG